jgi:hypothetical protein
MREGAGYEQMGREGAAEATRQLQDLTRRQDAGGPGLDTQIEHWTQIYDQATHRGGGTQAVLEAAPRNPDIGALEGMATAASPIAALPLSAEDAPVIAKTIAEVLQPGSNIGAINGVAKRLLSGLEFEAIAPSLKRAFSDYGVRMASTAEGRLAQIAKLDDSGRSLVQKVHDVTSPEFAATLRSKQRAEGTVDFALSGLGPLLPERKPPSALEHIVPPGAKPTEVEQALDSGLILPGREPTATGPAQLFGPRGERLSMVARRSPGADGHALADHATWRGGWCVAHRGRHLGGRCALGCDGRAYAEHRQAGARHARRAGQHPGRRRSEPRCHRRLPPRDDHLSTTDRAPGAEARHDRRGLRQVASDEGAQPRGVAGPARGRDQ